jgi:hypothetical protein
MIYEGTNEIQAIDLLVRKVLPDGGQGLQQLMQHELNALPHPDPELTRRAHVWAELTQQIVHRRDQVSLPFEIADDYLRGFGLWLLQLAWRHIEAHLSDLTGDDRNRWTQASAALRRWVLPEWEMRLHIMRQALSPVGQAERA